MPWHQRGVGLLDAVARFKATALYSDRVRDERGVTYQPVLVRRPRLRDLRILFLGPSPGCRLATAAAGADEDKAEEADEEASVMDTEAVVVMVAARLGDPGR